MNSTRKDSSLEEEATWSRSHSMIRPRITAYEDLPSAVGRAIAYRAERHLVGKLLSEPAAVLRLGTQAYALHDLALRGVSLRVPLDVVDFPLGKALEVSIEIHGQAIYRGFAKSVREERQGLYRHIALQLSSGVLDILDVRRRDADFQLLRALQTTPAELCDLVPQAYREVLARICRFVRHHRISFDRHAMRYQDFQLAAPDLAELAYEKMQSTWFDLRDEAAMEAEKVMDSVEQFEASKVYTEEMLTQELLTAPFIARAYRKPLGYAGDYQTITHVLDDAYEGTDTMGRVIHRLGCNEILGIGIRTRKDKIKAIYCQEMRRWQSKNEKDRVFRVMSIASGSAREVVELVKEKALLHDLIEWTLVDQEEEALQVAYREIHQQINKAGIEGVTIRCIQISFVQIVKRLFPKTSSHPQDFIYASGIFDYLRDRTARNLLAALFENLNSGGLLVVCNAARFPGRFWLSEMVLDWSLIARSPQEMSALVDNLPNFSEHSVELESAQAYYFLSVRRGDLHPN